MDRYDSSERSDRYSFGFGFPSLGTKSQYPFPELANVFKNPILQSADYDCDDFDSENGADCEDDCFVDSSCSSSGSYEENDVHWLPPSKKSILTGCDNCHNNNSCASSNSSGSNENSNDVECFPSSKQRTNGVASDTELDSSLSSSSSSSGGSGGSNQPSIANSISAYTENIRFPSYKKTSCQSERLCRWSDCVDDVSSGSKLIEHLQTKHVNPQTFSETYICLWNGCKVFGKPSCSRTWLERHVLSHGGSKPYKCIVDDCGHRFSSQSVLERHINQHFETPSPKEYSDGVTETAPKLMRRNGQKLRYKRQSYSVRSRADVFDAGIMSQMQYLLVQMAQRSKSVSLNVMDSGHFLHVTFQPTVIGCRQETNGNKKYLIRWYPYNALEDEWLPTSEIENTRSVPIWKLPASVQQLFWNSIFPNQRSNVRRSRKYKTNSSDTR